MSVEKDNELLRILKDETADFPFSVRFLKRLVQRLHRLEKEDRMFVGGNREGRSAVGSLLSEFAKLIMFRLKAEIMREARWRLPIFEDIDLESLVTHEDCRKFIRVARGYLRWKRRQLLVQAVRARVARMKGRLKRSSP